MINPKFILLMGLFFLIAILSTIWIKYDVWNRVSTFLFSKKKPEKTKRICPKCGSTSVQVDFSNPVVWAAGTQVKYRCKKCGHISYFFPEVEKDSVVKYESELRKEIKENKIKPTKEKLVDIDTGFIWIVQYAVLFLIVGLFAFILGFYLVGIVVFVLGIVMNIGLYAKKKQNLKKKLKEGK